MKKLFLVFLLVLITTLAGYSQSKKESIQKLFALMKLDSLVENKMKAQLPILLKIQGKPVKDAAKMLDSLKTHMAPYLEINRKMNEDMADLYEKHFTEKEINYYIDFYQSPYGKKLVDLEPVIQKEMLEISFRKYSGEIMKTMFEMRNKR